MEPVEPLEAAVANQPNPDHKMERLRKEIKTEFAMSATNI